MKTNILILITSLLTVFTFFSCNDRNVDVEDKLAKIAILGKWQLIAASSKEINDFIPSDDVGLTWTDEEFLSDGTLLYLNSRYYPVGVVRTGRYKIYADSLVSFFDGKGSSQKYRFRGDTLYIGDLHYTPPPVWVLSFRYFVYKRKN